VDVTVRAGRETVCVGGKGINVARYLASRGAKVVCGGLLGADNAALFELELKAYGIVDCLVRVKGVTRRNEMIVKEGRETKVNAPSFPDVDLSGIRPEDVLAGAEGCDVAILSGSLPGGLDRGFYGACVRALKKRGLRVVLDTSGEALKAGLAAGPDLVKPNAEECAVVVGFVPKIEAEFREATRLIVEAGIARARDCAGPCTDGLVDVIISDGAKGAWFDGMFVAAPKVEVVDTTAAGDTLLAEYCLSGEAKRAVAAGSAACEVCGSVPPAIGRVEELLR